MKSIVIFFTIILANSLTAQQVLTFEDAIKRTLANNFDIRIERLTAQEIANENNIGNAGYLPQVGVNGDKFWSSSNTRQEFFSGQINDKKGAKNTSLSANVRLDWTFFDGFAMFARDNRLQLREDQAVQTLNAQIEMSLYQTAVIYYSLSLQQQMNQIYQSAVLLSIERYKIVELKRNNGAANELQFIQAKLDLNADSAALLAHNQTIFNLKRELAAVMGNAEDVNFSVTNETVLNQKIDKVEFLKKAQEQNTNLLIQKSTIAMIDMERKEAQGKYYPQLSLYAQYAYGTSQSQVGVLSSNRSAGPGIGFTLHWTILDHLSTFTALKNNRLQQESAELTLQKQEQLISKELALAFDNYDYASQLYQLENGATVNAEELFSIAKQSYENGSMTALELREIQFSIIQAKNRQLSASLALESALLNIQLLSGNFKQLL